MCFSQTVVIFNSNAPTTAISNFGTPGLKCVFDVQYFFLNMVDKNQSACLCSVASTFFCARGMLSVPTCYVQTVNALISMHEFAGLSELLLVSIILH